jgi:hypothetical protein
MSIIVDIGCAVHKRAGTVGIDCRVLPAYFWKRCRRYLWNVCEEMTVIMEAVKP